MLSDTCIYSVEHNLSKSYKKNSYAIQYNNKYNDLINQRTRIYPSTAFPQKI